MNIYHRLYDVAKERCIAIGKNDAWIFEKEYANAVVEECIKVLSGDESIKIKLRNHFTDIPKTNIYKIDFLNTVFGAATLGVNDIGYSESSGWTIIGDIHEDYYEWVNDFEATHPAYGYVKGNFEVSIEATSKKAYDHFMKHYSVHFWDYGDI